MSSVNVERAARSGAESVRDMATKSAKGVVAYQPVSKVQKAVRWSFFTSPLTMSVIFLTVGVIYNQLVIDGDDTWTALDVISVVILSYIARRMLL